MMGCIILKSDLFERSVVEVDKKNQYIFTDNLDRTSGNNQIKKSNNIIIDQLYFRKKYPNVSQAVIRGLYNAYPITTKKGQYSNEFFRLEDFDLFKITIDKDIERILDNSHMFDNLIVSLGGFATEKAVLPEKMCQYLQQELLKKLTIRCNMVNNKNGYGLKPF
jgi:hypothetical protein